MISHTNLFKVPGIGCKYWKKRSVSYIDFPLNQSIEKCCHSASSLLRLIEAPDFSYRACRSRCVEAWYAEVASAKDAIYIYLQTKHQ